MGEFWTVLLGLLLVVVTLAPGLVLLFYGVDADRAWPWVCGAVLYFCVWIAAASALAFGGDDDGYHEWRGGHGPETRCEYQVRQETSLVGKVPVTRDVVYTVCK